MRRKPGTLLPLELALLEAAIELRERNHREFYGYGIAKVLRDHEDARRLTAHGTLYRALDRLLRAGLLDARWEDPEQAAEENRPRRRLYSITAQGERALALADSPRVTASRVQRRYGSS
jgi:PadR family transcriptional regulator, regulatory protein PadR